MRLTSISLVLLTLGVGACGDDGNNTGDDTNTPDAKVVDIGFTKPTAPLMANHENPAMEDDWIEDGPANLACLGTPSADVATTTAIAVTTKVTDFQSGNASSGTSVTVYKNQESESPLGPAIVSDQTASVTITIPAGTKRFGYKMVNPTTSLPTLLINQYLKDPTTAAQHVADIQIVSTSTAATLPALIGVSRTTGTGVLAGALRDCDNKEVSNFIATVSSTSGTTTHLEGVDTYYFSPSVGLPVRHSQQDASSKDGLFMAIEMQPTATAYVQIWGYINATDLAEDKLSLISETKTSVVAETVITGSYEPLRTN